MDYSRSDFKSWSGEVVGAGSRTTDIPIGAKIVHVDVIQSGTASNSWLSCGGSKIAYNYARDVEVDLAFTSTTTCIVEKTGNDNSFFAVIYSTGYPTSTSQTNGVDSVNLTADGIALVFGMALAVILGGLFWWKDRFSINRYE